MACLFKREEEMKREYRSFTDARKFVRSLKLKNEPSWRKYCKSGDKPNDIPYHPDRHYKNKGWISIGDWLGTGNIAPQKKKFRSFEDAKKFVKPLKLKGQSGWGKYCKSGDKPDDIPSGPNAKYKTKWISWGDFLGTGNVATRITESNYLPLNESRKIVRELSIKYNIKTKEDWLKAHGEGIIPKNIPLYPWRAYSKKRIMNKKKDKNEKSV